eukprot:TRINITY_DN8066_c0_g1_i1.p1 TRINITY_DN8066_c0_g1~~TRINITY_DN8066_c0_g1_i1.p1  ORF type:complete len:129 (-),score=4.25 TRINITY_DN8066_c0_g1_i1:172-558(-)
MLYGCIFFWIADSNSVERARAAPISQRPLATTDTDNTVRPERSRPIPGCQPLSFHFFMVVAEPVSTSYYDTKQIYCRERSQLLYPRHRNVVDTGPGAADGACGWSGQWHDVDALTPSAYLVKHDHNVK